MNSQKSVTCNLSVDGMHCAACEILIEEKVGKLPGVKKVKADLATHKISVELASKKEIPVLQKRINEVIGAHGYHIVTSPTQMNPKELLVALSIAVSVFIVFLALQKLGIVQLFSFADISYPAVFIMGVLASLSSCMAVVGSLVLTLSSHYSKGAKTLPMVIFHVSRIAAFFILGGIIGYLGSKLLISKEIMFAIDFLLLVVMVLLAIDLIGIFPVLSKFSLHFPKVFGKETIKVSESTSVFAPILLGVLTFFLPCGFTQSMQFYALSSRSFITGALVMGIFALGTLPALGLISFASMKFSQSENSGLFYKTAGFIILFFAVMNFYGALVALGYANPIL